MQIIVIKNGYATLPEEPIKNGYSFVGWSLDNSSVVDVTSNAILENTIYYALFDVDFTGTYSLKYLKNFDEENCIFSVIDNNGLITVEFISSLRKDKSAFSNYVTVNLTVDNISSTIIYNYVSTHPFGKVDLTILISFDRDTGNYSLECSQTFDSLTIEKI